MAVGGGVATIGSPRRTADLSGFLPRTSQRDDSARGPTAPAQAGSTPPPAHRGVLSEFEHLLLDRRCPVCVHLDEAERSFFSWFKHENYGSPELRRQIRAGRGMCPTHSRRSAEELDAGPVMTTVMSEALAGALQHLRGEGSSGGCVVCESLGGAAEYISHVVSDSLRSDSNARLYREHGGMCLPHVVQVASVAPPAPETFKLIAERLLASLGTADGETVVHLLAGTDDDASRRCRCRHRTPSVPSGRSTLERLARLLAVNACPVCLAGGLAEQRYLLWLGERDDHPAGPVGNDPGELCGTHTHDAALSSQDAGNYSLERKRMGVLLRLQQLLDGLSDLPAPSGRRRSRTDSTAGVTGALRPLHACPACHARSVAECSELELLAASTALAPIRRCSEDGHGMCVRHALSLPAGALAELARRHTAGRIAVVAWEVNEAARKYAWQYRHELPGPEQDAWLRALVHIDGRVFLGAPAPSLPAREGQTLR